LTASILEIDMILEIAETLLASVFRSDGRRSPFRRSTAKKTGKNSSSIPGFISQSPRRKSLPREEVRQAFRKEPNNGWEEKRRCSDRRPLGGGMGRLKSKLCGRRCIASMRTKVPIFAAHEIDFAAVQLCAECRA